MCKDQGSGPTGSSAQLQRDLGRLPHPATAPAAPRRATAGPPLVLLRLEDRDRDRVGGFFSGARTILADFYAFVLAILEFIGAFLHRFSIRAVKLLKTLCLTLVGVGVLLICFPPFRLIVYAWLTRS
ncbi:hypothetical protein IFR05_009496 [Cadophora sp. M221]|nr:hypothetical protein IFR05_009496 [Cadophora sp. M221]